VQDQEILPKKVSGRGGKRCKRHRIALVPRVPGMYGGRTDGVAAVASSAAWLCEWKQLDVANNDKKATPRWKRYWSKESSPQGLASEQSQNFFVCAVR